MDTLLTRMGTALRNSWIAAFAAAGLFGCSGSGGDSPAPGPQTPTSDSGTLLISLTDADGDFAGYSVDVLSVTLERRGGASVEVLPAATRIDFAQLTELSDLLAVATLAPGDIVGGTIRLDYGNAEVLVESGGQVVRAQVVGADGVPLGVTELDIRLPERGQPRAFERVDGHVDLGAAAAPHLLAVVEHRRLVLLPLADDDDAAHGDGVEHRAHGVSFFGKNARWEAQAVLVDGARKLRLVTRTEGAVHA